MPDGSGKPSNRLLVPFIVVCVVCAAEAAIIMFLLGRATRPAAAPLAAQVGANSTTPVPSAPTAQSLQPTAATAAATPSGASANTPAVVRGKVHQRVEAGGLAVTVLDVADQPQTTILFPPGGEKFADCDVLLENTGPKAISYHSALIKIQDDQARIFNGYSIAGAGPLLGTGTLVPGGKARGHIGFDLPNDVKGLTLLVPVYTSSEPSSIQIDLGR